MTWSPVQRLFPLSPIFLWSLLALCFLAGCGGEVDAEAVGPGDMFPEADFRFVSGDMATLLDMSIPPDTGRAPDVGPRQEDAGARPNDGGGDADSTDAGVDMMIEEPPQPPPDPLSEEGTDTDGDGLDDAWEIGAGDETLLDWQRADTDGDGTPDGSEDFDADGLTALEEQAAGRMESMTASHRPHPFRADLLIEFDTMADRLVSPETLNVVVDSYRDSGFPGRAGHSGISVHFYGDQFDIEPEEFNADFAPRQRLLRRNGPLFVEVPEGFPSDQLIHVIVASRRVDRDTRGGEVVTHADDISRTGVLIYADTIADVFPRCGLDDPPPIPFVTVDEALAGTLVHEIGHTLQLGHDTEVQGGINPFNIMSVPTGCVSTRQRAHGEGNDNEELGNTEAIRAPRFSEAATALIQLTDKLSVDTSRLIDGDDGQEM